MARIKISRQNKKRRETKGILFVALLFFVLFPYVVSGFSETEKQRIDIEAEPGQIWVLEKKLWGNKKIALEDYLVGMVAATIPVEYHTETLKAQAVILRSFCMSYMEKADGEKIIEDKFLKEYYFSEEYCKEAWGENYEEGLKKVKQAVEETKGIVLVSGGDIIRPPFCRMSNGKTRDITEYVVHTEKYGYLKSVDCGEDIMAKEAVQYAEIPQEEFQKILKKDLGVKDKNLNKITIYKDSLNYVKEVQIGENRFDGEEFREAFELPSSCYFLEKINNKIEIKTIGIGHGYGFSQYSAHCMASTGNDYRQLLTYFFANIALEKI